MAPVESPNVGVAFALVCGAGAATAIGASVVFFPSLVKLASRRVLAGALGLSAGVMTYVSFVEIFQKAVGSFEEAGHTYEKSYLYTTLCFFGGVLVMLLVDFGVKKLSKFHAHSHGHDHPEDCQEEDCKEEHEHTEALAQGPHCACCMDDPVGELKEWQEWAEKEEEKNVHAHDHDHTTKTTDPEVPVSTNSDEEETKSSKVAAASKMDEVEKEVPSAAASFGTGSDEFAENEDPLAASMRKSKDELERDEKARAENKKLVNMGINTALAIGLHNFPEGLATFVAALDDPRVGAVLAIAIGIHNIPEGLCVALPIYYATGNRCKAFMWACVSGISEPIAALLGWAILANSFSQDLYAILFGFVAGMMVIISTRELLPTAHRYDPEDTVVTLSFICGMIIMALSLVLFLL